MSIEKLSQLENPHVTLVATGLRTLGGRPLAIATAVVFFISSTFPLVAGLSKNTASFPRWWGVVDVALAFVLTSLAFGVMVVAQGREDRQVVDSTYRAYRILNHGILVMLVVFFLFGDRIVWSNCLPGFAWRSWLLLYRLPAWFTALRTPAAKQPI